MTSFDICLEKEGATTPSSHPGAQKVPQGFGGVVCHSGREKKPQILASSKSPHYSLCGAAPFLGERVIPAAAGEKKVPKKPPQTLQNPKQNNQTKKEYLKNCKNVASEHGAVQSRKQIHNSSNLAPFHTTDCSMADVKCIYGVGTFPATSWGLGKISVICLRETLAWLEMKSFLFSYLQLQFPPSINSAVLSEGNTQNPALPQEAFPPPSSVF